MPQPGTGFHPSAQSGDGPMIPGSHTTQENSATASATWAQPQQGEGRASNPEHANQWDELGPAGNIEHETRGAPLRIVITKNWHKASGLSCSRRSRPGSNGRQSCSISTRARPASAEFPPFETAARSLKVEPINATIHSDEENETAITALGREPGGGPALLVGLPSRPKAPADPRLANRCRARRACGPADG